MKRTSRGELAETVAYAIAYAPDRFPYRDYLPGDGYITLDQIYAEMREKFDEIAHPQGDSPEMAECRAAIEESYGHYMKGDKIAGMQRLNNLYNLLMNFHK